MNLKGLLSGKSGLAGGSGLVGIAIGVAIALYSGDDDLDSLLARAKGEPAALLAAGAKKICAMSSAAARIAAVEGARERLDVDQDVSVTCTVEESAAEAPNSEDIQAVVDEVVEEAEEQEQSDTEKGQAEVVETVTEGETQ